MALDTRFYYKKDRLNQVRGFCSTVKCDCSQAKAAKELNVEPATINKQISSLERDFKVKLFNRENRHKLVLTSEGEWFYQEIIGTVQKMDSVFENLTKNLKTLKENEIKIGAHHTIFVYLIPRYINKFKAICPDIKFTLKYLSLMDCLKELKDDKLDIVLYPIERSLPGCEISLLYDLDSMLLVNKNNPLSNKRDREIEYKDLMEQDFLMIDADRILPYYQKINKDFKFSSFIKFEQTDWEMIRGYVKMNLGVHLYSDLYNLFPELKDPDIVSKNTSHLFPSIKIHSIVKEGKIQIGNVNKFLEMIKKDF